MVTIYSSSVQPDLIGATAIVGTRTSESFEHTEELEQFLDTPVLGDVAYQKKQ